MERLEADDLAITALRRFTGQHFEASFRGRHQFDWVQALFARQFDLVVVGKTGSGKSLAYCLPPMVEAEGCTVVIQPILALVNETAELLSQHPEIKSIVYQNPTDTPLTPEHQVIVCCSTTAATAGFTNALMPLTINRIIIDEAHCYKDDQKYRGYANGVAALREHQTQFVFMTASLPPPDEEELLRLFNAYTNHRVFRDITARPELSFQLHPETLTNESLFRTIHDLWNATVVDDKERAIVFIESRNICDEYGLWFDLYQGDDPLPARFVHHSGQEDPVRQATAQAWRQTPRGLMIATSGFGAGINHRHVRLVVIVGLPDEDGINKAYQEAGRAGRDGLPSYVHIFAHRRPTKPDNFQAKLLNPTRCIQATFSEVEDGQEYSCARLKTMNPCSTCASIARLTVRGGKRKEAPSPLTLSTPKRAQHDNSSLHSPAQYPVTPANPHLNTTDALNVPTHFSDFYTPQRAGPPLPGCFNPGTPPPFPSPDLQSYRQPSVPPRPSGSRLAYTASPSYAHTSPAFETPALDNGSQDHYDHTSPTFETPAQYKGSHGQYNPIQHISHSVPRRPSAPSVMLGTGPLHNSPSSTSALSLRRQSVAPNIHFTNPPLNFTQSTSSSTSYGLSTEQADEQENEDESAVVPHNSYMQSMNAHHSNPAPNQPPFTRNALYTTGLNNNHKALAQHISAIRTMYDRVCGWCLAMGFRKTHERSAGRSEENPDGPDFEEVCDGMKRRCLRCCQCVSFLLLFIRTLILTQHFICCTILMP